MKNLVIGIKQDILQNQNIIGQMDGQVGGFKSCYIDGLQNLLTFH